MTYNLIGDQHLGRRFVTGVPLDRRGDREAMIWEDFTKALSKPASFTILMGDLFDRPTVPLKLILDVYNAFVDSASGKTTIVVIAGNHDLTRTAEGVSAFDILAELLSFENNVWVVKDEPLALGDRLYVPYSPVKSAKEMIAPFVGQTFEAVYGHWDVAFSEHNLIPVEELQQITKVAFTGHIHKPEVRTYGDLTVNVVGSLQPFAHGEEIVDDPRQPNYYTVELDELATVPRNSVVRVILDPDATLPDDVDFLQITTKRRRDLDEEVEGVSYEEFDIEKLFIESLQTEGVSEKTIELLKEMKAELEL